jgi:hypothetical protein
VAADDVQRRPGGAGRRVQPDGGQAAEEGTRPGIGAEAAAGPAARGKVTDSSERPRPARAL